MNQQIEAQVQRRAEADQEIENQIALHHRRRRRMMWLLVVFSICLLGYGARLAYERASVPEPVADDYFQQALQAQRKGNLEAAAAGLKQVLQLEPERADARWMLSQFYVALGDGKAAEKEIRQTRVLGRQGPEITLALLQAMMLQRRYTEVLVETISGSTGANAVNFLVLQGEAQLGLKQLDKAKATFLQALERAPDESQALLGLARANLALMLPDEAGQQIGRALELDAEDLEGLLLQGRLELVRSRPTEARQAFDKANATSPSHPEAQLGLTQSYLAEREPDLAEPHLSAIRAPRRSAVKHYLWAVLALQKGDTQAARNALERLSKSRSFVDVHFLKASLNYDRQEYQQALVSLNRLLKAAPDHIPARTLLAAIQLELDDPENAIKVLLPAETIAPEDGYVLALLARAHSRIGEAEQAEAYLSRAAETGPGSGAGGASALESALNTIRDWQLPRCRLLVFFCQRCLYTRICI